MTQHIHIVQTVATVDDLGYFPVKCRVPLWLCTVHKHSPLPHWENNLEGESQQRLRRIDVMWSRRRVPDRRRAAVICSDCSLVSSAIHPSIQYGQLLLQPCNTADATGVNTNSITAQKNKNCFFVGLARPLQISSA